jgi:peptidyl-tRNA hydrolase
MAFIVKDRQFDPARPLMFEGARLYILARTDIAQMNPGKLAAQVAHAATQFVFDSLGTGDDTLTEEMHTWRMQGGGGFGTKITLAATEAEIRETIAEMDGRHGLAAGVVIDPTYPMVNFQGETFTRQELTCGYVFVPHTVASEVLDALKGFDLYP